MFATACEKASKFTRPVIVSTRTAAGKVSSGLGAFIIVNRDGWFVTAGHLFDSFVRYQEEQKREKAAGNTTVVPQGQSVSFPNTGKDPKRLTNHSFWWGADAARLETVYVNREIDIAVGKLNGFRPEWVAEYPVIKNPDNMKPGTSLCRLGFPFIKDVTEFDESTSSFRIRRGILPMAFFPNEGIHTRNLLMGKSVDGGYEKLYVETSSPGIKGQSGGPIFDKNGFIAGMQVFTEHFALDFRPSITNSKGETVEENQFMNIGVGVHVKTIKAILDSKGIKYDEEGDDQGFRIIG